MCHRRQMGRAFVLVVAIVLTALGITACKRACESSTNCKRTCSCLNTDTEAQFDCTLAFRCDSVEQTCEADFEGLSCNDICEQYAKNAQCGFQRCNEDAECTKALSCPVTDDNGAPVAPEQFFDCTLTFSCDQTQNLCQAESTIGDEGLCIECRRQAQLQAQQ